MPDPQISPAKLAQLIHDEPRLRIVDVRTGGEFESVHIPGSYNVPIEALSEHHHDLVELGDPVVLICQSGGRASRAEAALLDAGMDNVRVLAGGMNSWIGAGGETATISARWPMDRQIRLVAGSIVFTSVVASAVFPKAKWIAGALGAGLAGAALTNTCAMGAVLSRLPYNQSSSLDVASEIARLREAVAP